MTRKLEEKRARREAREQRERQARAARRRGNLATAAIAVAIAAVVVVLILQEREQTGEPVKFGPTAALAGCAPVQRTRDEGNRHLRNGEMYTGYRTFPPTSGPHWVTPAPARFYDQPLPVAQVVHNLEHGQIVIYYRGLSDEEKTKLRECVSDSQGALLAMPAPDGIEGKLAVTAWTALQTCREPSSAALDAFRRNFQGRLGPERLTPPFEG